MRSSTTPTFTTAIRPDWKEIETIQQASGAHLKRCGMNEEAIAALQMVSGELLENAVKYGHFPSNTSAINFSLRVQTDRVTVEVTHPVGESDDSHFRKLDAQIQWIRGFQNAFDAYIEKLKEVSTRENFNESGLGLVRIAYEGQSVLDFFVDERNQLSVSAVYSL